jgi:hypothetical protein
MSQFLLSQDLRHLPPWLIFDVRQNKNPRRTMPKAKVILLSLAVCHTSAVADPMLNDQPVVAPRYHFGAQTGPMGIRGMLDTSPADTFKPPLYRFQVLAYGRIVDGELLMAESSACPTITIYFPQPLKLRPDLVYTFIGEDAGEGEQMFLVGGKLGRLLDQKISEGTRLWNL